MICVVSEVGLQPQARDIDELLRLGAYGILQVRRVKKRSVLGSTSKNTRRGFKLLHIVKRLIGLVWVWFGFLKQEDDSAAQQFCEADIDQILQSRSRVLRHAPAADGETVRVSVFVVT